MTVSRKILAAGSCVLVAIFLVLGLREDSQVATTFTIRFVAAKTTCWSGEIGRAASYNYEEYSGCGVVSIRTTIRPEFVYASAQKQSADDGILTVQIWSYDQLLRMETTRTGFGSVAVSLIE